MLYFVIVHNGNTRNFYVFYNINIILLILLKTWVVFVTNDLSWHINVVEVVKKASRISDAILHVFCNHYINIHMCVFNIYVSPLIEYCVYMWFPLLLHGLD